MDSFILTIFQIEIAFQCKTILHAANGIDTTLANKDSEQTWMHIQTILISAANISRMLWPDTKDKDDNPRNPQRQPLRDSLDIDESSPFRNRDIRNDFEHFDERVEDWYGTARNYVGRNIGPAHTINIEGETPNTRFQHFDPQSGYVSFLAHSVNLFDLIAEAASLHTRATTAASA